MKTTANVIVTEFGDLSIHHPDGTTVEQAHAAALTVKGAVIRETKPLFGHVFSFGYVTKAYKA